MVQMIRGYWVSQVVGTVARLGIPDRLASGAMHFEELAEGIACKPESTYRLLRASASLSLVSWMAGDCFSLTPMEALLRSNVPRSTRDCAIALTAPAHWLPSGRLTEAVQVGERQRQRRSGENCFNTTPRTLTKGAFSQGQWPTCRRGSPDEAANLLDTSTARNVVDVGGASGTIIAALLAKKPVPARHDP
jgi:hypothetical protein